MTPSDQELIEKAKAGDKQAFGELFERYKNKILGYLYRYIGNFQTAEDLAIETFLNAYGNIAEYEERGAFQSWLYMIATNCARRFLRQGAKQKEVSLETPLFDDSDEAKIGDLIADEKMRPDYEARKKELKYYVYAILRKLDKKYRDPVLLCLVEGMGYKDAAKILKCKHITVGTRLKRGREMIYDELKERGYDFKI